MPLVFLEERLRKEQRDRTIVVVRVVHPVRVELDLAIVEVQVRGVVEPAIGIRIIAPVRLRHRALRFTVPTKKPIFSQP